MWASIRPGLRTARESPFTSGADATERWSDWSPDGDRIVYDRSGQAWVMNADGTGQEALTGGTNESGEQPAFSPDGTKIVFHSNAFDAPNGDDIFVMNDDGTGVGAPDRRSDRRQRPQLAA